MTISLRGPRLLVPTAVLALVLAIVTPASAATVIRTSTAIPGVAWASSVGGYGAPSAPYTATADGGLTWAPARMGEVAGRDQVRWAIGPTGELLESSDGGATWQENTVLTDVEKTSMTADRVAVADIVVDPDRPGVVYAVIVLAGPKSESFTVVESTDDGATWTPWRTLLVPFFYADTPAWQSIPGRDAFMVVDAGVGAGTQTIRIVTPTSDRTVVRQRPTPAHIWTGGLQVDRGGSRILLQTTRGWMLSTDGGAHPHALVLAHAVSPVFDPSGAGHLYALSGGTIFYSNDAGRRWQRRGRAPGANVLAIDRAGRLVYASGPSGDLVSRDGGVTFKPVDPE